MTTQVLAPEAVARGFLEAVAAVEDLRLDVPDSPDVLATFISRAVVDDVLPPSFVESIPAGTHRVSVTNLSQCFTLSCRPSGDRSVCSSAVWLQHAPHVFGVFQHLLTLEVLGDKKYQGKTYSVDIRRHLSQHCMLRRGQQRVRVRRRCGASAASCSEAGTLPSACSAAGARVPACG